MESDVCVVGGGPAGLISAKSIAENGWNVTLFDSRRKIGSYEHCAGLLSIEGLSKLGLQNLPLDVVQNTNIRGANIFSPSGRSITVQKNHPTAYVVNRSKFNEYLHRKAEDLGVISKTSTRVIDIYRTEETINLKFGKKNSKDLAKCKIAVLAEGRFPRLNSQVGLNSPPRDKIVFSTMYVMNKVRDIDIEFVELYQDQTYAPGFFSWIIPIDEQTAKVGIASKNIPASTYLDSFIKKHPIARNKLKVAEIETKMSGAIPLGSTIKKTYTDNIIVVGDAAGQTKPTTGGGVIFGGIAATIAGKVINKALSLEDYSRNILSEYSKLWKKELKVNLFIMKQLRQYLNTLSVKDTEKLFKILDKNSIKEQISSKGDVDNQKDIVLKMLTNLEFWPFLLRTGIKYLIKK